MISLPVGPNMLIRFCATSDDYVCSDRKA